MKKFKGVKTVNSVNDLKLHRIYVTSNMDMFEPIPSNRNGEQKRRVNYFTKIVKNGDFKLMLGAIFVFKRGDKLVIIDGHHRYFTAKKLKTPIAFIVTDEVTVNDVALINSSPNPKWDGKDHFTSALTDGYNLALVLNELRANICEKYKMDAKKLSASELYGILVKNVKHFGSGLNTPTREMYNNDDLIERVYSEEYLNTVDLYASFKCKFDARDAYKYGKEVMKIHLDTHSPFNLKHFHDNAMKYGFKPAEPIVSSIKDEIVRVFNKGLKRNQMRLYI